MKNYDAITKFDQHTYNGRIITYGLTDEENTYLKNYWRNANYEIYNADIASDLIAISANAIIVNATKLNVDDLELLENYYTEVGNEADEIVFWIGTLKPAIELQTFFKCVADFDELATTLHNVQSKILRKG